MKHVSLNSFGFLKLPATKVEPGLDQDTTNSTNNTSDILKIRNNPICLSFHLNFPELIEVKTTYSLHVSEYIESFGNTSPRSRARASEIIKLRAD